MPTLSAVIKYTTNIDQLKRELKAGTDQLVVLQGAADRTVAKLGGEGMIRAAHNAAAAVQKLGGTAALTAKEQDRLHGQMGRVIEKLETLNKAAAAAGQQTQTIPAAFKQIYDATTRAEAPISRMDKALGVLKSTFAQFTAASLAASLIQKATAAVGEFVATGAKLPGMEASFQRLTSGLGQNAQAMLATMQTATKGLVSNYDLMASANKAMLLGLPVSTQQMGELAKTATVLGKAMGQDATTSLNDLITALGRSSPLILDNLGLTVKVGEANERYAAKIGKTVEQLTDAEKKTAFYQAAMEAARAKVTELGEQTKTLGEIATSVWVAIGNEVSATTATINVGVGAQVSALQLLIQQSLDYLHLRNRFATAAKASTEEEDRWTKGLRMSKLEVIATAFGLGQYVQNLEAHAEAAKLAAEAQQSHNAAMAAAKKLTPPLPTQPGIKPAGGSKEVLAAELAAAALDDLTEAQKRQIQSLKDQGYQTDFISAKLGIHADVLEMLDRRQQAATKASNAREAAERKIEAAIKKSTEAHEKYEKLVQTTNDLLTKWMRGTAGMTTVQTELHDEFDRGTFIINRQIASLKERATLLGIYSSQNTQTPGVFGGGSPTDLIGTMGASTTAWLNANVFAGIQKSWLQSFAGMFKSADFGQMVSGSILSAIQGGGNVGQAAGAAIGGNVFGSLAKSLTSKVSDTAAKVTGWMGGALNAAFPILGSLLGQFGGKMIEKIIGAFDRNKGRDTIEKWVKDSFGSFDELHKQLRARFNDATAEQYWKALTQGVGRNNPKQAKDAIDAVTAALTRQDAAWDKLASGVNARSTALMGPLDTLKAEYEELEKQLGPASQKLAKLLLTAPNKNDREAARFALDKESLVSDATRSMSEIEDRIEVIGAEMRQQVTELQPEFERLGQFAAASFAGLIRSGHDAAETFANLKPTLDALRRGVSMTDYESAFGFTSTPVIDELLAMESLVTANQAVFDALSADTQMMTAFRDAGIMTMDLYNTFGADVAEQFKRIEESGGDVAKAMALNQPVLQQLWELQQKYGVATDEATAALLKQAEEQGLVGAEMKSVNDKILDVLLAIGKALGADLPLAVDKFGRALDDLGKKTVTPTIDVEVKYRPGEVDMGPFVPPDLEEPDLSAASRGGLVTKHGVQYLGRGGSVWRPHGTDTVRAMLTPGEGVLSLRGMAMLGALNRGIEPWLASASLSGMGGAPIQSVVIMEVDGREFGRAMVPVVPGEARRLGVRVRA